MAIMCGVRVNPLIRTDEYLTNPINILKHTGFDQVGFTYFNKYLDFPSDVYKRSNSSLTDRLQINSVDINSLYSKLKKTRLYLGSIKTSTIYDPVKLINDFIDPYGFASVHVVLDGRLSKSIKTYLYTNFKITGQTDSEIVAKLYNLVNEINNEPQFIVKMLGYKLRNESVTLAIYDSVLKNIYVVTTKRKAYSRYLQNAFFVMVSDGDTDILNTVYGEIHQHTGLVLNSDIVLTVYNDLHKFDKVLIEHTNDASFGTNDAICLYTGDTQSIVLPYIVNSLDEYDSIYLVHMKRLKTNEDFRYEQTAVDVICESIPNIKYVPIDDPLEQLIFCDDVLPNANIVYVGDTVEQVYTYPFSVKRPFKYLSKLDVLDFGLRCSLPIDLALDCYDSDDVDCISKINSNWYDILKSKNIPFVPCGKCCQCLERNEIFNRLKKLDPQKCDFTGNTLMTNYYDMFDMFIKKCDL